MASQLIKARHSSGYYLVRQSNQTAPLAEWIKTHRFREEERSEQRIDTHGRLRSQVYSVTLPETGIEAIMKVSVIDPGYKPWRRLELFLHQLIRDYNLRAFKSLCQMHDAGSAVAKPLAFWNDARGLLDRRSYLLYQKIPDTTTVADFCQDHPEDKPTQYRLAIEALKSLHAAGFRHGDPHLNNVLLSKSPDKSLCFIDYDRCHKTYLRLPLIKTFFDLRDVALLARSDPGESLASFVDLYCGSTSRWQYAAARFWTHF